MIGFQTDSQKRLFYSFDLEDHIPQNHLFRGINPHLDLSNSLPNVLNCILAGTPLAWRAPFFTDGFEPPSLSIVDVDGIFHSRVAFDRMIVLQHD
jgi:hypothetical protein